MESQENRDGKRNGLVTTLLVHAILLVLCFFLGFTYYVPPKGDVAIGFEAIGEVDAGKNAETATNQNVTEKPQEEQTETASSNAQQEDDFASQDNSDVTLTKNDVSQADSKAKDDAKKKPAEKPAKKVDERLTKLGGLLQGPDNPGGSGDGVKEGNQGGEDGVPSVDGQGGNGTDGMFDFGGRKAINPGNLRHDCQIRGTVKVRVKVDRKGHVIQADMVSGGTSFDQCLIKKAIAAAKGTKYSSNSDGPEFQEGIITLRFHVN